MMDAIRTYWRVVVLVVLVVGSVGTLAGVGPLADSPSADATTNESAAEQNSLTTLRYGLDLAGGTRIRAPLIGLTAEDVSYEANNTLALERDIAAEMSDADPTDVTVRTRYNSPDEPAAIEVTAEGVEPAEFKSALDATGVEYETVREGVTKETREETVRVLNDKVNKAGLSGGTAREVRAANGEYFILVEVPDQSREDVRDIINDRGVVRIDIYYPTEGGYETKVAVLEQGDFHRIGGAQSDDRLGPHVPVVLNDDAAARFEQATMETGLAPSGSRCAYEAAPNQTEACLLTLVDGEVVYSAGMSPGLAEDIASGNWKRTGSFVLQTENQSEAQSLALHLRAGALPAKLDMDSGTSTYVSATQGDHFKKSGLLIGLLATLAVALKVFYRYRDVRVAAPMVATAMCEVVILLGFAAGLGYPIDLAVIGGLIAVIGTGVDDLIIIANEVLAKGDVKSQRIFRSRFKKAFWVIGAAAVTTIVAMSPLMVMSLGDLRGFAIFTIVGVIVGVCITRPAYGDVLEKMLTEEH